MRRAIFAHADALSKSVRDCKKAGTVLPVVGSSMDDLEVLQRAHAHCWRCVEVEHEERRGDRDKGIGRIGCQAVGNSAHGMLSHTIVDVTSAVVAGYAARRLQIGLEMVNGMI
jgi:hypothetical protein